MCSCFLWRPLKPIRHSPRKDAGPSMLNRKWAAAGWERRTWRKWRKSWMPAWIRTAAPHAGSPPHPPLPLKLRASMRTLVRKRLRWPKCPRPARGGEAWQPRWGLHHPGLRGPTQYSKHLVRDTTVYKRDIFKINIVNILCVLLSVNAIWQAKQTMLKPQKREKDLPRAQLGSSALPQMLGEVAVMKARNPPQAWFAHPPLAHLDTRSSPVPLAL